MLQGGSTFYLMSHTHVQITNNHARRGGGIYVEDGNAGVIGPCFFQLLHLDYPYSDIDSVVTLENNTADEAGSVLYRGDIDKCYLQTSNKWIISKSTFFAIVFKIRNLPSLVSQVSSNPFVVHLFNLSNSFAIAGSEIRSIQTPIFSVYPGQMLKVPVQLYGQRNGSVPGIVHAYLLKSRGTHLAPLEETQQIGYLCENFSYTIFSTGQRVIEFLLLRVNGVQYYANDFPVFIGAFLLPCPPGFQLSNIQHHWYREPGQYGSAPTTMEGT